MRPSVAAAQVRGRGGWVCFPESPWVRGSLRYGPEYRRKQAHEEDPCAFGRMTGRKEILGTETVRWLPTGRGWGGVFTTETLVFGLQAPGRT